MRQYSKGSREGYPALCLHILLKSKKGRGFGRRMWETFEKWYAEEFGITPESVTAFDKKTMDNVATWVGSYVSGYLKEHPFERITRYWERDKKIIETYEMENVTQEELAKRFGVCERTIRRALNGR